MNQLESAIGTTTFLVNPNHVLGDQVELDPDEAAHAVQVLRVRTQDVIRVVDGHGWSYDVRVTAAGRRNLHGRIIRRVRDRGELPVDIRVVVGIPKQRSRLEWIVEKLVELGVARLQPVRTARTERVSVSLQRLSRIVEAATKQCGRSRFMQVDGVAAFEDALAEQSAGRAFVCHERASPGSASASDIVLPAAAGIDAWVGPAGGFTDEEIQFLIGQGAQLVHLGARRLRTETAAVAIAAILSTRIREIRHDS